MSENTAKKPRRKRRTKAQVKAEAEAALEKEVEVQFGSSYEKEIDAIVEETVASSSEPETPVFDPSGLNGLAKLRQRRRFRELAAPENNE